MVYNLLDLFSGIGGFSLGLERSGGFKTIAFCEIEPFPRRVLKQHWPEVPIYEDVRTLTADRLVRDGIAVDAICGGFPCQDISAAGKGAGIEGERSGLRSEYRRIIGELRPRVIVVENVAMLLGRGIERVLGDLAALGYDAEWHCIPASAVGACHRRDRVWIVAYPHNINDDLARHGAVALCGRQRQPSELRGMHENAANADKPRLEGWLRKELQECARQRAAWESSAYDANADKQSADRLTEPRRQRGQWFIEPDVGRVADGVPSRVDRLKGLGNAVVPQIPEIIGSAIMSAGL